MRRTYPAQNCNLQSGFSLIEVIVAVAVVAITTAAASSAILLSRKIGNASMFDQDAAALAIQFHAKTYGLLEQDNESAGAPGIEIDQEAIASTDESGINWTLYRLRQTGRNRSVSFAIALTDN